jgi:pyridoxamine 5'-phosphate oxidase-like protein
MGQFMREVTAEIREFIEGQKVYFVATAPLSGEGHVNLSPKGMDSFRVLSSNCVAYLDLTGSGNETAAHLLENGRITIMFCAFEGKPMILRLYGRGRAVLPGAEGWEELAEKFVLIAGARQIIYCEVERVQTSCGLAVPVMRFEDQREGLVKWAKGKGEAGLEEYRRKKNVKSIDGMATPFSMPT